MIIKYDLTYMVDANIESEAWVMVTSSWKQIII